MRITERHTDIIRQGSWQIRSSVQRENLQYCKKHGIHLNSPKLGKSAENQDIRKKELHEEWLESGERGDIERRFGINKRCYSLGCVTIRLQHTSEVMIYLSLFSR